jgi:hypothetical protein
MRKGLGGKLIDSIQKLSMFEIFLVSSWDISHSQFGIQSQILASRGYRDTANFRPCICTLNEWHYGLLTIYL